MALEIVSVTVVNVYPFKGFYDSHVDAYHDNAAFEADPLAYWEERDYQAGQLLGYQADWSADYIAGKAPPE